MYCPPLEGNCGRG